MSSDKEQDVQATEDAQEATALEPVDYFKDAAPLPGYEKYGRVVLSRTGGVSGSPANYEALNGKLDPIVEAQENIIEPTDDEIAAALDSMELTEV